MTEPPESVRETLSRLLVHARRTDVPFAAAGIAYYAQVSLLPTGVLAFVAVSTVADEQLAVRLVGSTGDALSPSGRRLLSDAVTARAGRVEASVAGVVVLGWGSFRLFRGLKTAMTRVYAGDDGIVVRWRDSAVTAVAVATSAALLFGAELAFESLGVAVPPVGRSLTLGGALVGSLYPVYYVLPETRVAPADAVPGTVLAAGGLVVLRSTFRSYLGFAGGAVYGVLGAVVMLVTWLYVASLLLVLGGVLNAVLAGQDEGS